MHLFQCVVEQPRPNRGLVDMGQCVQKMPRTICFGDRKALQHFGTTLGKETPRKRQCQPDDEAPPLNIHVLSPNKKHRGKAAKPPSKNT